VQARSISILNILRGLPAGQRAEIRPNKRRRHERRKSVRIELSAKGRLRLVSAGTRVVLAAVLAVMIVQGGRILAQQKEEKPAGKSLYQRMGGYDVIAGIVDDFIGQLRNDHAFDRFGGGRSHSSLVRTRQLVVDQICNLTGGPCIYIGREMKAAHEGLAITDAEWDSSVKKFQVSLDKFKIGEPEQKEFIAMIQKLKPEISEKPDYDKTKEATPKTQN
jgi:hemoglobin